MLAGAFILLSGDGTLAQDAPASAPVIGTATLPRDLSPWGMFSTPIRWCRR